MAVIEDERQQPDGRFGAATSEHDQVSGETAPLIPPGIYDIKTFRLDRRRLWGTPKVMISCEVIRGEYDGVLLTWCANALPKAGRRLPISSKAYRAIVLTLGRRPEPRERISETLLVNKVFSARVRTVTQDAKGHPLPSAARYSVIDDFVERVA